MGEEPRPACFDQDISTQARVARLEGNAAEERPDGSAQAPRARAAEGVNGEDGLPLARLELEGS